MILSTLIFSFALFCVGECVQPYFPPQITFSPDGDQTIYAIDQINQRAYLSLKYGVSDHEISFVMKHFPDAIPDSPESKYYVQLLTDSAPAGCMYGTYWQYGGNVFNSFPSHWVNGSSYEIKNYIQFKYPMIHSNNDDEDHWYSNETCQVDGGESYPCEEIYFKKNTDIPLRFTQVLRRGWNVVQVVTNFGIKSIGKPDEKYFDSVPKNWSMTCRDVMLGLLIYSQTNKIELHQSVDVQIWLITPPHRINGNDTVVVEWKTSQPSDTLTWSPKRLAFNIDNFQQRQNLTITRVKNGPSINLNPVFYGGGFDLVPTSIYPIYIQ